MNVDAEIKTETMVSINCKLMNFWNWKYQRHLWLSVCVMKSPWFERYWCWDAESYNQQVVNRWQNCCCCCCSSHLHTHHEHIGVWVLVLSSRMFRCISFQLTVTQIVSLTHNSSVVVDRRSLYSSECLNSITLLSHHIIVGCVLCVCMCMQQCMCMGSWKCEREREKTPNKQQPNFIYMNNMRNQIHVEMVAHSLCNGCSIIVKFSHSYSYTDVLIISERNSYRNK